MDWLAALILGAIVAPPVFVSSRRTKHLEQEILRMRSELHTLTQSRQSQVASKVAHQAIPQVDAKAKTHQRPVEDSQRGRMGPTKLRSKDYVRNTEGD